MGQRLNNTLTRALSAYDSQQRSLSTSAMNYLCDMTFNFWLSYPHTALMSVTFENAVMKTGSSNFTLQTVANAFLEWPDDMWSAPRINFMLMLLDKDYVVSWGFWWVYNSWFVLNVKRRERFPLALCAETLQSIHTHCIMKMRVYLWWVVVGLYDFSIKCGENMACLPEDLSWRTDW